MLNSLLPFLNVIYILKPHVRTPPPTLLFFPNRFVSATSLPQWGKMLCQQRRYSWHQVSKNPRIKAAIIHNTCLSRHHLAQSFYTPIRLKLYITCGERREEINRESPRRNPEPAATVSLRAKSKGLTGKVKAFREAAFCQRNPSVWRSKSKDLGPLWLVRPFSGKKLIRIIPRVKTSSAWINTWIKEVFFPLFQRTSWPMPADLQEELHLAE